MSQALSVRVSRGADVWSDETDRRLREEQGFSQETFAQFAQIERARYGKIERGQLNISLKVLFQLARRLKVSPAELMAQITVADCQEVEPEN